MTTAFVETGVRPAPPRRTMTMVGPLLVFLGFAGVGGAAALTGYGILWGVLTAGGLLIALRLGKLNTTPLDSFLLLVGMVASAVIANRVMPSAPQSVDVLLSLKFGLAFTPMAIASAVVAHRGGARPSSVFNAGLMWLVGGAAAPPLAEALGVLLPLDQLRRGQEPTFDATDYVVMSVIVSTLGGSTLLAVRSKLPALATGAAVVIFTLFAGSVVGFSLTQLFTAITGITEVPNLDRGPNFAWAIGDGTWWWPPSWDFGNPFVPNPLVETIRIAVTATIVGCLIALPLSFLASTLTAPNHPAYLISKGFLNFIRTIPDLFWAMIFVTSIGFGPLAGALALTIFTMSIMAKLLSETVDGAEPGPLEAAKATGSRHFPAVRAAVFPQVLPSYIALGLYIFELSIRSSTVLGLVGAGGIGMVIEAQRSAFRFDRILAILIPVLILVILVEQISNWARRKLL